MSRSDGVAGTGRADGADGADGTGAADPDEWQTGRLDLAAYLARIGERGGPPTAATLDRLHRAHVSTVPFENLDLVLGREVRVDIDGVARKLVGDRRGGYCYEHGVLFAAALEQLGFRVRRLLARIGYHPERPRPCTHMTLHVSADDGELLADVGFGAGLLAPLPWAGDERSQGGWSYRLVTHEDGTRELQERGTGDWSALYSFSTEPRHASDVTMANHFTATHPSSPFVGRPVVMRRGPDRRLRLLGRTLELIDPGGTAEQRVVADDELPGLLADTFGLPLSDAELAALVRRLPPQ